MPPPTPDPSGVDLYIDGVLVDRDADRITLGTLVQTLDGVDTFEFSVIGGTMAPPITLGQSCHVDINGTRRFTGRLVGAHPQWSEEGVLWGYRALGLAYLANLIPVTNPSTGNGTYLFNLPSSDPDYLASLAGQSIGDILLMVLKDHSDELDARGIGSWDGSGNLTGTAATDLAALATTPPGAISVGGERLWQSLQAVLDQHAPHLFLRIEPDGEIVLIDTTDLTDLDLTVGDDPIEIPNLSWDLTDCATAVVLRGGPIAEAAKLSTADGTLTADWTAPEQTAWKWEDYSAPKKGLSTGTITAMTTTTVTVDEADNTRTWSANEWGPSDRAGEILLRNTVVSGVDQYESRPIASNTSLSAGGTSVITVEYDLVGSGYNQFEIRGLAGGYTHVWRKYTPTDSDVADALLKRFPRPVPFRFESGVQVVQSPMGEIRYVVSGLTYAVATGVEVDPATGAIWFASPTVAANNSLDTLLTGGGSVTAPDDVVAFVPIQRGNLEARYPSSGYAGTAYSVCGIEEELVVDLPAWNDAGAQSQFEDYAELLHASLCDAIVEGQVTYNGLHSTLALGSWINLDCVVGADPVTTGLESAELPIRTLTIEWPRSGPDLVRTHFTVSNRRRPLSGDRLFQAIGHWEMQAPGGPEAFVGPTATGMNFGNLFPDLLAASGLGQRSQAAMQGLAARGQAALGLVAGQGQSAIDRVNAIGNRGRSANTWWPS